MMSDLFEKRRAGLANGFAQAGAELLHYMLSSSAIAAIPDTQPQQYVVAGTVQAIIAVLPKDEQSSTAGAAKGGITSDSGASDLATQAQAAAPATDERAAFEAWARSGPHVTLSHVFSLTRASNGHRYVDGDTELCWRAWKEAKRAKAQFHNDGREAFEVWARAACNMPPNVALNWDAVWTKAAWEGWEARCAHPAAAVEPAAIPAGWISSEQVEMVAAAMKRAYNLGQTYWAQADSDYTSQHKKSEATAEKFIELTESICAALAAAPSPVAAQQQQTFSNVLPPTRGTDSQHDVGVGGIGE